MLNISEEKRRNTGANVPVKEVMPIYIKVHTLMRKRKENSQWMLENGREAARMRRLPPPAFVGNARAAVVS